MPARVGVLIFFVLLFAVVYYVLHAHKYQNCLITPGLFEWPSTCV
ncbi:hypothetical protein SAMN05443575_1598 [Jatrophihabitans endophyticus]|uniref:Uncharacterized protein n=1 Tax=Jatrophihabitans endophyticus TaxID=1206085 RepID=A0A1M5HQ35_9ACTN|nr:hypothetical protein [Jatrophihabitans endophyticus]SHG18059.1 hypothetical protein SAMN05443575_1598 [Jatrophihabitans endophyticus]